MRRIKAGWLLLFLLAFAAAAFAASRTWREQPPEEIPRPLQEIINPYREVDWSEYGHYRANLHTHTNERGGRYEPRQVIDMYHEEGYHILSITDHNRVTWPWEKYNRNPEELNMIAIQGNEISGPHDVGSYFSSFESKSSDVGRVLEGIGSKSGLAVFFHAGRYHYSTDWYCRVFQDYPHLVGLEVINRDDRYPRDREKWDKILTRLMPRRPVWGFANDDMHKRSHLGVSLNIFLMEELCERQARNVMERGQFYFVKGDSPPHIKEIEVDSNNQRISIKAGNYEAINWISAGEVIYTGASLDLKENLPRAHYVRAEIKGPEGKTFTNPFGLLFV